MAQPLDDFIDAVRTAESLEQERFFISTEQAQIRAFMRNRDPALGPRVVSKLIALDIFGENVSWGQMEVITLMSHDVFSQKRVGYVGASVLLDDSADLAVLVTQTLLRDLQSGNPHVQCLALTFVANVASAEVCRAVASVVQGAAAAKRAAVLKRAGMAIVRIVRTNADLTDTFKNTVQRFLNHTSHGVMISGINLVVAMLENEPRLAATWAQFAVPFTKILKNLASSRGSREFSYGVFNDPFMLMKTMRALALFGRPSDELDNVLQSIISAAETSRNAGRAVLYQAVDTVVAVSTKPALRGLAFNQVGRLLAMREANVLYSALSSFARVLYLERAMINRGSVDAMALQRYKSQIVKLLDHNDPSIRRRALDVVSALIDEQNVETLIPEILAYVRLADAEFRAELVTKICAAAQRFAPTPAWNFDTIHAILVDSGDYVSADVLASFCELIAKSPGLQAHAVARLSGSVCAHQDNQSLLQVCAFVLGEFAREEGGNVTNMRQILALPQTRVETRLYIITALAKLAVRFGLHAQVGEFMAGLEDSHDIEVQQRAGEMRRLLAAPGLCGAVLTPVASATPGSEEGSVRITLSKDQGSGEVDDLLLLVMDNDAPATTLLDDLAPAWDPTQAPVGKPAQGAPVMETSDFVVFGQTQRDPRNPKQYALRLVFVGTGASELPDFKVDYVPASGWQVMAQAMDGSALQPRGGRPLAQVLYLLDRTGAAFSLRVRAAYRLGSQPLSTSGVIARLPE